MKLYDISLPVSDSLPVWPGDPKVSLTRTSSFAAGDALNITRIMMGAHTGTHVDAPSHFLEKGRTVDDLSLEACNGSCMVIESRAENLIGKNELEDCGLEGCERVLFKTRNSRIWDQGAGGFREDYVALSESAALYLADKNIRLVGIDYLSIEGFHAPGNPVHKILLERDIVILEGLNLSSVNPGAYELICLPLRLKGAEGAPARALLRG
jgi:arylformamidase